MCTRCSPTGRCPGRSPSSSRAAARSPCQQPPPTNPFERFGPRLALDLPRLLAGDAAEYHDYAFATVRMAGSAFEAAHSHVRWLFGDSGEQACMALAGIVEGCKA